MPAAGGNAPPKKTQLFVVCCIRKSDGVLVASVAVSKDYSTADVVEVVMDKVQGGKMKVGGKFSDLIDENLGVHFQLSAAGCIYAVMTSVRYSPRVAFAALAELQERLADQFGTTAVKGAAPGALSKDAKAVLKGIVDKFGDPEAGADALAKVQSKLDRATETMRDNIDIAVKNTKMLENIEEQSEALEAKSKEFQV